MIHLMKMFCIRFLSLCVSFHTLTLLRRFTIPQVFKRHVFSACSLQLGKTLGSRYGSALKVQEKGSRSHEDSSAECIYRSFTREEGCFIKDIKAGYKHNQKYVFKMIIVQLQ